MKEEAITFYSGGIELEGVLRYPGQVEAPLPGILLIHGSMEHDRDGNLLSTNDGKQVHRKNFFLELSSRLCCAGFAAFSWDRRGFGKSQGPPGDYFTEAKDAKAALDALCLRKDIVDHDKIAVFGQSAGVYTSCLLAKEDNRPCAYVLSGGLCSSYKEMMSFNYHRARDYANKSFSNLEWVEKNDLRGLVLGINLDRMFEAAGRGKKEFRMEYKGHAWTIPLNPKVYTQQFAPNNQFRHINRPALIIHGKADLNVPACDAVKIEEELRHWGNSDVELVLIEGADHSFQQTAPDEDTRIRERMSLESFKHPYVENYFQKIIAFLKKRITRDDRVKKS